MRRPIVFFPFASLSAAAVLLTACSSAPSNSASGLPPASASVTLGSTGARPNFNDAAYVKIHFHNDWYEKLTVETKWSYPLLPHFYLAEQQCLFPNTDWTSEIGFQFPDGQVLIKTLRDNCDNRREKPLTRVIAFEKIQFTHADPERATITADVKAVQGSGTVLCGRQSFPIQGDLKCDP